MRYRTAARTAGALFLCATVSFSVSVLILEPVLGTPDYLAQVALHETRVAAGTLFELVNHVAVVGIALVLYPVLRPFSQRLALGYVAVRSIEAVLFAIGTMHLLALVKVSQDFLAAGSPGTSHYQTLSALLWSGHDWNDASLLFTAFSAGALILNAVLYRARLVPRWLSVWGLVGAVMILAARIILMSGIDLSSAAVTVFDLPIMLQEIVFALWLIFKGFYPGAFTAEAEVLPAPLGE
ncbi:MAG TPA: DUF4386 domain-containing protein [Gemmatimonadota bacterium]|nr:DUF4386 domain-containing protein [Gemmatimonadota bacterium]